MQKLLLRFPDSTLIMLKSAIPVLGQLILISEDALNPNSQSRNNSTRLISTDADVRENASVQVASWQFRSGIGR